MTTSRRRAAGLPLLLGAVLLASATAFAIASLRAHADERKEAQVLLAGLHADVQTHTAAIWEAIANGSSSTIQVDGLGDGIGARFDDLARVDPGEPVLLALIRAYGQYELATADVLAAIGARRPQPAPGISATRDTSTALAGVIAQADASYRQMASVTSSAADIGTTTTLVSAAVLLVLLFRRAERARRTTLLLAHEQRVLRFSEERFRALVQRSSDMLTVLDMAGVIRYQSPSAQRLAGVRPTDMVGHSWRSMLHADDAARVTDLLEACAEGRTHEEQVEWRLRRADGNWLHLETAVTNLHDEPSVQGIVLNSRDVGERHELQERLAHQAFHDDLTGLPNRAQFLAALRSAMARAHRRAAAVALLLLDLDQFKNVNDSLGHAAGDELLIGVARRLRGALRDGDTAARLAGDEFVVMIQDPTGPEDAARVAERIGTALRRPFSVQGHTVFTSASIGIVCRAESAEPEELLRDADVALYRAKAAGEHGFVVFEPDMHAAAVKRLQDETDLRQAVAESQFTLAYQPILDLSTARVVAVEALLRWRHPRHGDIPPARFIPIAEETGLIHTLGWWVLETAASQLRDWRRLDPALGDLQMAINLSARQLHEPELLERLTQLLVGLDLPASALVLELTEGAFNLPPALGADKLAVMRRSGIRIAIDDFGTGYSTLGRLRDLPVDMIKIDRSFVMGVEREDGHAIVRTMIELARALGLTSVAEGVETEAQLEALRGLGCDAVQGYLLGRPNQASVVAELLLGGRRIPPAAAQSPRRRIRTPGRLMLDPVAE